MCLTKHLIKQRIMCNLWWLITRNGNFVKNFKIFSLLWSFSLIFSILRLNVYKFYKVQWTPRHKNKQKDGMKSVQLFFCAYSFIWFLSFLEIISLKNSKIFTVRKQNLKTVFEKWGVTILHFKYFNDYTS